MGEKSEANRTLAYFDVKSLFSLDSSTMAFSILVMSKFPWLCLLLSSM